MNLVVETYKFLRCGNHTARMMLQGREGDSPAADQVPGRQAWAGGRIRGMLFIIPFLEALLTIRVTSSCLLVCMVSFGFHASFSPPLFFFRWVLFLCVLFSPFFLSFFFTLSSLVPSCLLPCFPNIGDERNSRARKGTCCTIQMWDYTRTYIYVYICGALILPAFAYIICMLTSACVCVTTC
jgi:hypothetical protein